MNLFKSLAVLMIVMLSAVACDDVDEMTKKAKKIAIVAQQQVTEIAITASDAAGRQMDNATQQATEIAAMATDAAEQKMASVTQQVTTAVNNAVFQVAEEIKAWIYEILTPFFPWMFIFLFLFLFVVLKYVIPFGNFVVIQLPLSIIAYTISFWLFSTVGLTSFAIKGSLWVVVPIAGICFTLYFSRNYILPKLTALNDRLTSKFKDPVEA